MQELDTCRKRTVFNTEDTRHIGKHNLRCLESVEEDRENMGVTGWRLETEDREGQFWKRLRFFKECNARRKRKKEERLRLRRDLEL